MKARLCLRYWTGEIPLPSKDQMLEAFRIESQRRKEKGSTIRQSHLLDVDQVSRFIYIYQPCA